MKKIARIIVISIYSIICPLMVYAHAAGQQRGEGFRSDVIETLGVMTITGLILTFLMGYFMSKNRKLLFIWHKRAAIATMALAASHALMVSIF